MAFTYSRSLTVDHTKCGASDSSSFPVLVSASDVTMKDVAHSGHVQSSLGADILFFSDSALTTQIPSEIDFYDNVNGILVAWVQVGTVSHTVDTVIYIAYGNASPPARTTNPWDSNYKGVWHLGNGTVLSVADSSAQGNNGTNSGTTARAGQIDGGGAFAGSHSIATGTTGMSFGHATPFTFSAWVNPSNLTGRQSIFSRGKDGTHYTICELNTSKARFLIGSATEFLIASSATISTGVWTHVVAVREVGTLRIYVNGAASGTAAETTAGDFFTGYTTTAISASLFTNNFSDGLDEVRVSDTNRGPDWITTEYNNQNAPGNIGTPGFLTWGSESVSGTQQQFSMLGCGS